MFALVNKAKKLEWEEESAPRYAGLTPCWNCVGHALSGADGYPQIMHNGPRTQVSRFLYEELFGKIPFGLIVRHKCDNPACINPEHFLLGTHRDNMRDKVERGRWSAGNRLGQNNPLSKLTDDDVRTIRQRRASGESGSQIARDYGVGRSLVCAIHKRQRWQHII